MCYPHNMEAVHHSADGLFTTHSFTNILSKKQVELLAFIWPLVPFEQLQETVFPSQITEELYPAVPKW